MPAAKPPAERLSRRLWRATFDPLTRFRAGDDFRAYADFRFAHGRFPNNPPRTFTDHVFRLKVSDELESPLRVRISDKEFVKDYVREKLGDDFNVPVLAVLRTREEARRYGYPAPCVIKPTHASAQVIFRHGESDPVDLDRIESWFSLDKYRASRERNYRDLVPKVIVEKTITHQGRLADDYKVYCFRGRPKFIGVIIDRRNTDKENSTYTLDWKRLPFRINGTHGRDIERPARLDDLLRAASALSADISFARVDFYWDGTRFALGEITNLPASGHMRFFPLEADALAGRLFAEPDLDPESLFAPLGPIR